MAFITKHDEHKTKLINMNESQIVQQQESQRQRQMVSYDHKQEEEQRRMINLEEEQRRRCYNEQLSMKKRGYKICKKLTKTLQGSIWNGYIDDGNFGIIIKSANRDLHEAKSTVLDGEKVNIEENIISEAKILHYLTYNGSHFNLKKYITNYINFFYDEFNYFLVMENGGSSLFEFVLKAHQCILSGKLSIFEWQNICKIIFNQIITFLNILHNKMNICHLDISLENMLINDVTISTDRYNKIHFVSCINIKIIDFGLSEMFDIKKNPNFLCNKFCGKTNYKSPQIYNKKPNFNAKCADIWSIGICLFALIFGCMPFHKPSINDPTFEWIITGNIEKVIKHWKKINYINKYQLDILKKILINDELQRIQSNKLLKHSWFIN